MVEKTGITVQFVVSLTVDQQAINTSSHTNLYEQPKQQPSSSSTITLFSDQETSAAASAAG